MANPAANAPNAASPADTPSPTQRPTVDLTALTDRDDFLLELGEALGGQASVNPVDSIDSVIGQLASTKRGQMLVIDARSARDVRALVQRATQQAPNAVVVVFAEADSEKQVASAVKGTSVFAVLTIPIEGAKTTAVLDAAIADAGNRSAAARGSGTGSTAGGAVTLDAFRPTMSSSPAKEPEESAERGGKWPLLAGLGSCGHCARRGRRMVLHPRQDSIRPGDSGLGHHRLSRRDDISDCSSPPAARGRHIHRGGPGR